MNKSKTKIQYLTIVLAFFILPIIAIPVQADVVPVIPLDTSSQMFEPTIIGNNSLYVVPAGYTNTKITYHGNATFPSPSSKYTALSTNKYASTDQALTIDSDVPDVLSQSPSTLRTSAGVPNYFLPTDSLPVLVNMSDKDAHLSQQNSVAFSVHMGHSSTIFFNSSLTYYLVINSTSPFFIDVEVLNSATSLTLNLTQTLYPGSLVPGVQKKLSIPVIPMFDGTQVIKITGNKDSLVTFNTLPFDINSFGKTEVSEGQYYSNKLQQGSCVDLQTTSNYDTILKTLDLKFFQFPVESGNTYQLYFYKNSINENYGSTDLYCPGGSLDVTSLDSDANYNYAGGSISNQDTGMIVNAKGNGFINITLIASGYVQENYGFYFVKNNNAIIPIQHDLIFNKPVHIDQSPNKFYTFTLQKPSMLAINYTASGTFNPSFDWSMLNPVTNQYYTIVSNDNFNLEFGNLLNDSTTNARDLFINTAGNTGTDNNINWIYLPAGQYRLDATANAVSSHPESLFTFNVLEVKTFTNSITLDMKPNSLYAVELPFEPMNFNFINASTSAHNNISITYNWGILGAYRYLGSTDTVGNPIGSSHYGRFTLGNEGAGSIWNGYGADGNDTGSFFNINLQTLTNYKPILLISPFENTFTNGTVTSILKDYTSSLTISSNVDSKTQSTNVGGQLTTGTYIYDTQTLSTSKSVNINNDYSTSNTQIYAFKTSTNVNTLYKLQLVINGNYSDTASINASVTGVVIHAGNLIDTKTFTPLTYSETNTTGTYIAEFLGVDSTSYIFIAINRVASYNSTMGINLSTVNVKQLSIQSASTFAWNQTISPLEVADTTPLWNITNYQYPGNGGFDLVPLVIVGGGIAIAGGAGAYVYTRKKNAGKHP